VLFSVLISIERFEYFFL